MWLVTVPTGFGFGPWVLLFTPAGSGTAKITVAAFIPLVGLLPVIVYGWVSLDRVHLWPYVPLALAAIGFARSMIDLAVAAAREPDGAFIPLIPVTVGFIQPWLALGGGSISFIAVGRRSGGLRK